MSNDALDLAFARHVRTIGLISADQVNATLQLQSKSIQDGKPISFAEAMIRLGLLTPAQRESLEKKVKEQQAGVTELGSYKLMKKLGEGGMGAVYLALDPASQRHVAVKVLPRHLGTNAEFVKRFRREAEAAIKLKHPNIIGAFATGEDLGYHFYVMEYCEGSTLDATLAIEKRLAPDRAMQIAFQAARGLKYAHDNDIIHRDIKPSNIIVTKDGTAKILDLGLSKSLGESTVSFKTVTGAVLGTPHYISPEQAQGEKNVDGRTDIYSLGATLYHLVTGQVPFDGATALEILSKHVNTVLPNPQDLREDIPDPVVHVLLRMMAKSPADRYPDCGALLADLSEVTNGRTPKTNVISAGLTTIAPSKRDKTPRKRPPTIRRVAAAQKSRAPLIAGLSVAAAVVIVLAITLSRSGDPVRPPPPPAARAPAAPKDPEPPKGAFDVATWEKNVADLSPEAGLRAVLARLKDLNPGYDGAERHEASHGRLSRLELSHVALRDLSPLRALPKLTQLDLSGTSVVDLTPLRDLKLVSLTCAGMKGLDLRTLRGLKELRILSLKSSPVRDLTPLAGMELWQLNLRGTGVVDLSPLRQVHLRELICDVDPARDTEALRSMATLEKINEQTLDEFWPKERTPEPAASGPEHQLRSVIAKLKQLNPEFDGLEQHRIDGGVVVDLTISALGVNDLSPLRALTGLRRLDASGLWDNTAKMELRSGLRDLEPLRGMKLESLVLHHTTITDLEPLRDMKLDVLDIGSTKVTDLAPLRGMPLKRLVVAWTLVRDLSALEGMPLVELRCGNSNVTDFSPLRKLSVKELHADLDPKKHRDLVLALKGLESINQVPTAEFLKSTEKPASPPEPKPVAPLPAPPAVAGAWKNAIDLIPLIDPVRDAIRGVWKKHNGRIISEFGGNSALRILYEPPPEYDFRVVFTRASSQCSTAQFLVREGRGFFFEMGGYENTTSGFSLVNGKGTKENATRGTFVPKDGVKYICVIEVRRNRVTALVDDKKISEWVPSMGEISTDDNWCVDVPNLIGIGNCEALTTFEALQVREITGKGKIRTTLATPIDPAFLRAVAAVIPDDQVTKVAEKLRELNPGYDSEFSHKIEGNQVVEFKVSTQRIVDVWPVRALHSLRKLDLEAENSVLADISSLRGLKLQELAISNTRVVDLASLQGMPLQRLQISGTPVRDFSPLKTVPLQHLECERIGTSDFSALKAVRTLKTINGQPAADFLKSSKEIWTAMFDGKSLDFLRQARGWKIEKGVLVNNPENLDAGQTTFEFENAEFRIRFEVKELNSLFFAVRQSDRGGYSVMFDRSTLKTMEGRSHELLMTCQGERVTAVLDGRPISLHEPKPVNRGCLQFNGIGRSLRITAIDYRLLQ